MSEILSTFDAAWLSRAEMLLVQARRIRAALEERIADWGLSEPELALLWACAASPPGGTSQRQLAEALAVSPAQISALVERLAQMELLQVRAAPGDRRRRLWEPTAAGMELWRAVSDSFDNIEPHRGAA
ncbi:MAG: MarR family transcriptional regulator [Pirellulales bacterium]|nr:MarR family transcriptional regulator [Pirellulales bacterium]